MISGVQEILKKNEYKIAKYQAKRLLLNEKSVIREPVNGQSYLYLGRNYYLQYKDDIDKIEFKGRYFFAPNGSKDKISGLFKEFYRNHGKIYLSAKVNKYADLMGVKVEEVSILELKNRWASCSVKKPKVNFHWKIMMAPASVINYLIVHELTHFKFKRHDSNFWNEVDKILPDYEKQVSWLKENGASLTI